MAQWSSILMLRNLKSPEMYFQAAFRVQSPWSIKSPNGDFAPTRALRQLSEYGIGLSPGEPNPENTVRDLDSFLPVLAYDGANMMQIDAGGILDMAMATMRSPESHHRRAILDRLVHNAYRIELTGDSMRKRRARKPGNSSGLTRNETRTKPQQRPR